MPSAGVNQPRREGGAARLDPRGRMHIAVRTLTNRVVDVEVDERATVGTVLQMASGVEFHKVWWPRPRACARVRDAPERPRACGGHAHAHAAAAQDVVLVHRRTFKRYSDVEQRVCECGIANGDVLELTMRFAAQPSVTKLVEPIGFYEVSPRPASTGVFLGSDIAVHLVNITIDGRLCLALLADVDAEPVPSMQVWQAPNVLRLVPHSPLRADTLYTVTLDLALDAPGVTVTASDQYDLSCVADGVNTVRPSQFMWHFQTGPAHVIGGKAGAAVHADGGARGEPPVLEVVHSLLGRPLDGYSRKQLLSLQSDLGCVLNRVDGAIRHIDHKIETINMRLQEKARRMNGALTHGAGAGAQNAVGHELAEQNQKRLRED